MRLALVAAILALQFTESIEVRVVNIDVVTPLVSRIRRRHAAGLQHRWIQAFTNRRRNTSAASG